MGIELFFRKAVLTVAGNKQIRGVFEKRGMQWGVQRFVAGRSLGEAVKQVRRLNKDGLMVTLDFLGESVEDRKQIPEVTQVILGMLDEIHRQKLHSNVSLKLSQLGLLVDEALCLEQMEAIVARAKSYRNFIRIDMEDSPLTERTLEMFYKLQEKYGSAHVGVVIQSYLYRSSADVDRLVHRGANLRIVKGAYREPKEVAFANKKDVDENYLLLVKKCLSRGQYVAVATHDSRLIDEVKRYARDNRIPPDRFEFQMLYGIASGLQRQLVAEGYRVRVYTPFGEMWYPYFSRRIAERPANLWFVVKGLMRR